MALINCPDCAHEVSSRAKECPECRYPIAPEKQVINITNSSTSNDSCSSGCGVFIVLAIILIVVTNIVKCAGM